MTLLLGHRQGIYATRCMRRDVALPYLGRFNVERTRFRAIAPFQKSRKLQVLKATERLTVIKHGSVAPSLAKDMISPHLSLRYLNYIAQKNPFVFGLVTACIKAFSADVVAQKIIEGQEKLNLKRTLLFLSFGAVYSGILCNALFIWGYPKLFPFQSVVAFAVASSFSENFVNNPFVMFPIMYLMKECILVENGSLSNAWAKYKAELWETCITGWVIWIPAHIITFGIVPTHLRMPYVSSVSFIFFTALSLQQNYFDNRRRTLGEPC